MKNTAITALSLASLLTFSPDAASASTPNRSRTPVSSASANSRSRSASDSRAARSRSSSIITEATALTTAVSRPASIASDHQRGGAGGPGTMWSGVIPPPPDSGLPDAERYTADESAAASSPAPSRYCSGESPE